MGMNADVKKRWVEALRSGKYTQGRGSLRSRDDEFCCLGVLCDITEPDGWSKVYDGTHWTKDGLPHVSVFERVGLPVMYSGDETGTVYVKAGELDRGHEYTSLDRLNDRGWSFTEIADLIEEQL